MTTSSTSARPSAPATTPPSFIARYRYWLAACLCALAAFVVRLGHEPLWLDETYSLAMVQHPFADLMRFSTTDVHPPLYYVLLKWVTLLFGESPTALRLLSAVAATGLVALGAGPVRRLWNERTGWVFAVLTSLSAGVLCFAQEARMYALATCLVTGAVLYGQLALRDGRRPDLVAFGLLTWAAGLTHYFALVAVGINGVILLGRAAKGARGRVRPLALALALAALGFLPWLPFFLAQVTAVTKNFWVPETTGELVVFGLVAPFAYKFEDIPYPWQAIAAALGAVALVAVTLGVERWRGNRREVTAQLQLLAVFSLTLLFGLAFSFLVRPIFMPRYMSVCAGLFLLALAVGVARLPFKAGVMTTTLFVALGLPAWLRVQVQTFNGPFERLAAAAEAVGAPAPVLVHNGVPFSFALDSSRHVLPHARHVVIVPPDAPFDATDGGRYLVPRAEVAPSLDVLLGASGPIWLVDGSPGADPLDASFLDDDPRWVKREENTLEEPMSWVKLTIRRYERRSPAEGSR